MDVAPNRGFSRTGNLTATFTFTSDGPPVAMVTKIWEFYHKTGYNAADVRDRDKDVVTNRVL